MVELYILHVCRLSLLGPYLERNEHGGMDLTGDRHTMIRLSRLLTAYPGPGLWRSDRERCPPLSTNHTRLSFIGRRYAGILPHQDLPDTECGTVLCTLVVHCAHRSHNM